MCMASCWFNSFDKPPQPDALLQIQKFILNYAAVSICNPASQACLWFVTAVFNADRAATCLCELRICKMQEIEMGHTEKKDCTHRVNSLTVAQHGWLKSTGALPQNHMTCKKALPCNSDMWPGGGVAPRTEWRSVSEETLGESGNPRR